MITWFTTQPHYIQALLAGIFTWSITAAGAGFVFFFRQTNKNAMDAMLGFSAGVMIAASFWSLLSPSIEMAENLHMTPWITAFLGFFCGGLLLFFGDQIFQNRLHLLFKKTPLHVFHLKAASITNTDSVLVPCKRQFPAFLKHFFKLKRWFCPFSECFCMLKRRFPPFPKRSFMLMTSITLHNIPEGLAVGVAFGSISYQLEGATLASACLLALGIGLQNFPEGTAVSVPLCREGFSKKQAFFYGQLSALVEPVSALLGAILVLKVRHILPFILAFAAGAMIYVVVEELIPESQTNERKDFMALFTLIGFSLMMILDIAFG